VSGGDGAPSALRRGTLSPSALAAATASAGGGSAGGSGAVAAAGAAAAAAAASVGGGGAASGGSQGAVWLQSMFVNVPVALLSSTRCYLVFRLYRKGPLKDKAPAAAAAAAGGGGGSGGLRGVAPGSRLAATQEGDEEGDAEDAATERGSSDEDDGSDSGGSTSGSDSDAGAASTAAALHSPGLSRKTSRAHNARPHSGGVSGFGGAGPTGGAVSGAAAGGGGAVQPAQASSTMSGALSFLSEMLGGRKRTDTATYLRPVGVAVMPLPAVLPRLADGTPHRPEPLVFSRPIKAEDARFADLHALLIREREMDMLQRERRRGRR
jgi:hypothetical protein